MRLIDVTLVFAKHYIFFLYSNIALIHAVFLPRIVGFDFLTFLPVVEFNPQN